MADQVFGFAGKTPDERIAAFKAFRAQRDLAKKGKPAQCMRVDAPQKVDNKQTQKGAK